MIVIKRYQGFTMIELIMVIIILGILASYALPKFSNLQTQAKISTLKGIQGSLKSSLAIVKAKALVQGLSTAVARNTDQTNYIIETDAGRSEIYFTNLCLESMAEFGDSLTIADYISVQETEDLKIQIDNQYFRIGYDIRGTGAPTADGCYLTYNSFAVPDCTIDIILADC